MKKDVQFGKMIHGGDYNPEQWLDFPEILCLSATRSRAALAR